MLEHAILRAAQVFCEKTRAWVVELDPTLTIDGINEYDIDLPRDTELVRIESAKLNGEDFAVWKPGRGCGRYVFSPDARSLRFSRPMGADQSLVLTCSLKPAETATGIDDIVFARYVRDIALGAAADIASDPIKSARFNSRCDDIVYQLWKGNAAITQRTSANFF
ncbi:hypothetical protein D3C87_1444580 [compost metagenome]